MPKVNLSDQAYLFLKRRVSKKTKAMQSLPENELRKNEREVKHWQDIEKKFNAVTDVQPVNELIFKRVELRSLQNTVLETMVTLQSKTLPEYQERMAKIPDKKEFYEEYVTKAEALYDGLVVLSNAIQEALIR